MAFWPDMCHAGTFGLIRTDKSPGQVASCVPREECSSAAYLQSRKYAGSHFELRQMLVRLVISVISRVETRPNGLVYISAIRQPCPKAELRLVAPSTVDDAGLRPLN